MRVKILCEFIVSSDEDELDENTAKAAASQAAYNYLSFVEVCGYSSDCESVTVHVDGFGACEVRLGDDHE